MGRDWEYSEDLVRETWTLRMLLVKVQKEVRTCYWKLEERDPCYAVEESLATMSSAGIWKAGHAPNQLCDRAKEVSKQRAEGTGWFLLAAYVRREIN